MTRQGIYFDLCVVDFQ